MQRQDLMRPENIETLDLTFSHFFNKSASPTKSGTFTAEADYTHAEGLTSSELGEAIIVSNETFTEHNKKHGPLHSVDIKLKISNIKYRTEQPLPTDPKSFKLQFSSLHNWNQFIKDFLLYGSNKITLQLLIENCADREYLSERFNITKLQTSLDQLNDLGEEIKTTNPVVGGQVTQLHQTLNDKLNTFVTENRNSALSNEQLSDFKKEFHTLLHSKDKEMATHRRKLTPILYNIAIALTGVGLLALAYSMIKSRQFRFFPYHTRREGAVANLDKEIQGLELGTAATVGEMKC